MTLDSSALVAILFAEPGYLEIVDRIVETDDVRVAAPTLVEASLVMAGRRRSSTADELDALVAELGVTVVPFGEREWRAAVAAFLRFGRGRHKAALNVGAGSFTIEAWIKVDPNDLTSVRPIVQKLSFGNDTGNSGYSFHLHQKRLGLYLRVNGTQYEYRTNAEIPLAPLSGSVTAITVYQVDLPPLVIQHLVPLRIQSSPSALARVRMPAASEPASRSLRA